MSKTFTITSPLTVPVTKKKKFILNVNNYRNAHFRVLTKAKHNYKRSVCDQVMAMPKFKTIKAVFTLFPKTRRRTDTANVCSIHEKFLADAIVEFGRLQDDSYIYWTESIYRFGEVDKINPRVEVVLVE